ncbi:MAG: DNA methyltransferase, partial [Cyanobacteriota bacterium]
AKFIPQIPNTLIQELSSVGDTVLDPFCGSGTTLVEALLLKRFAIGVDANPLACLISEAKTTRVSEEEVNILRQLENQAIEIANQQQISALPLFPNLKSAYQPSQCPNFEGIDFWFDPSVIDELAILKELCSSVQNENARRIALTAFSSIIVAVSRQDSDTRYVRREKDIKPGDTAIRFARALGLAIDKVIEFAELTEPRYTRKVICADVLSRPEVGQVDLVVCSPPYPNAYSYHLYHRTRMLWLDMDQPEFKKVEIGSHRKYSRKGESAATVETFRVELKQILGWLGKHLRPGGYACFVIGDSRLKGQVINNDQVLIEVAEDSGYKAEANLTRRLQDSKKSFNPAIGKIKSEHIVILQNVGG